MNKIRRIFLVFCAEGLLFLYGIILQIKGLSKDAGVLIKYIMLMHKTIYGSDDEKNINMLLIAAKISGSNEMFNRVKRWKKKIYDLECDAIMKKVMRTKDPKIINSLSKLRTLIFLDYTRKIIV